MRIHPLSEASIKSNTKILVRADFNVTLEYGKVSDDFRVQEAVPSLNYIFQKGGFVRLISHLGHPKGLYDESLSLALIVPFLEKYLEKRVILIQDPFNPATFEQYRNSPDILLFENIRFWSGEKENNREFAEKLASWGEIFVAEEFAVSHRNHASIATLPHLLPSFAGMQFSEEISYLGKVFDNPRRPLIAVLAGKKLETKLPLIQLFLEKGDKVLVGGALINTIFAAKGWRVGVSRAEKELLPSLNIDLYNNRKLFLPVDVRILGKDGIMRVLASDALGEYDTIVDIGPESEKIFIAQTEGAGTIVWNGPLGLAENPLYAAGTTAFAQSLLKNTALKIVGGGHTIAALRKYNLLYGFDHISTGGGAMLEFLAGKKLPGIEALRW